jgi:DNA (cytosine-5)-methyltransferase 1
MNDRRNHLFVQYVATLAALKPAGFIFENVTGLLSMEGGRVFAHIRSSLESQGYATAVWKLQAEQFGVPQRRTRVIIVGVQAGRAVPFPPKPITGLSSERSLLGSTTRVASVCEALDDLPALSAGEDGSHYAYRHAPRTPYQSLMRGQLTPSDFIQQIAGAY